MKKMLFVVSALLILSIGSLYAKDVHVYKPTEKIDEPMRFFGLFALWTLPVEESNYLIAKDEGYIWNYQTSNKDGVCTYSDVPIGKEDVNGRVKKIFSFSCPDDMNISFSDSSFQKMLRTQLINNYYKSHNSTFRNIVTKGGVVLAEMTADEVLLSKGNPTAINATEFVKGAVITQWVYYDPYDNYSVRTAVTFRNNIVTSILVH